MEPFNFVLLFIVQVSVAQYVEHKQVYEVYNDKHPSGSILTNFPSFILNSQIDPTSLNGVSITNEFAQPNGLQQQGQLPNYNQGGGGYNPQIDSISLNKPSIINGFVQSSGPQHPEQLPNYNQVGNSYNPQIDPISFNIPSLINGFPQPNVPQPQGQLSNYNQAAMMLTPILDNILKQHLSDWRILQSIVNSFFDNVTRFVESFLSTPTIFGGTSRNSILNPANIDKIHEIFVSCKYVGLGFIKVITNAIQSLKYVIQFYSKNGNIHINDILNHLLRGFLKFWLFR